MQGQRIFSKIAIDLSLEGWILHEIFRMSDHKIERKRFLKTVAGLLSITAGLFILRNRRGGPPAGGEIAESQTYRLAVSREPRAVARGQVHI
jgi:hypothetical protein